MSPSDTQRTLPAITWPGIIAIEPGIVAGGEEAEAIPDPWWTDYSRLKLRLIRLVGWQAQNERLRTRQAYEAAIEALVEALRL